LRHLLLRETCAGAGFDQRGSYMDELILSDQLDNMLEEIAAGTQDATGRTVGLAVWGFMTISRIIWSWLQRNNGTTSTAFCFCSDQTRRLRSYGSVLGLSTVLLCSRWEYISASLLQVDSPLRSSSGGQFLLDWSQWRSHGYGAGGQ
jgi:hypothetical protein